MRLASLLLAAVLLLNQAQTGQAASDLFSGANFRSRDAAFNLVGNASEPAEWVVSEAGPLTTIEEALELARPGDTIRVKGGVYGPLLVNKSVWLAGEQGATIDGGGRGKVVTIQAQGVRLSGFTIRGSGSEPDRDHAGVSLHSDNITVENNRLEDVLFGIFVAQADWAIIRGNTITSKAGFDVARKGDAIRLWYSQFATVEHNTIYDARDVVAWYANDLVFRNNSITQGRYGIHLMYCDRALIEANTVADNSVGIYVMYSRSVDIKDNDIRRQRGPSGYALGFKDADSVTAAGNLLVDNRAGIFMDGTPFRPDSFAHFEKNVLAYNDIGVVLFSFVKRAEFRQNTLWENIEQVALQGSGTAGVNIWEGNYWSDYAGYDADGDGTGDTPYRSERFFEGLTNHDPGLRALIYSPVAQALELAAQTFPVIKPQPKLVDAAPQMVPLELPDKAAKPTAPGKDAPWGRLPLTGLVLLFTAAGLTWIGLRGENMFYHKTQKEKQKPGTGDQPGQASSTLVRIAGLTKYYGKTCVLQNVSLEVQPGQAVALWGANGAGKSTLIKALLGLVVFKGEIEVGGENVRRRGKQARRLIGYVPQEAVFYDMPVETTLRFYARLKKAPVDRIPGLMESLALTEHRLKPVPALSGGLKQRLALGIALLSNPAVLVLDEPTANLDNQARKDYLELLNTLRQEGRTIIFASHRAEEVEALADRVVVLETGRIVSELIRTESGEGFFSAGLTEICVDRKELAWS